MKRKSRATWATYERCFVLTLSLIFLAPTGYIAAFESAASSEWPAFAWLLLGALAVLGAGTLFTGVRASAGTVQRLTRGSTSHEASLFIVILAAPLYFILNIGSTRH